MKTPWRRLGRRKIVTLKTFWRRFQDMPWRRLQDVLKTNKCCWGCVSQKRFLNHLLNLSINEYLFVAYDLAQGTGKFFENSLYTWTPWVLLSQSQLVRNHFLVSLPKKQQVHMVQLFGHYRWRLKRQFVSLIELKMYGLIAYWTNTCKFKIDKITYSKCSLEQRMTLAKISL